MGPAKLTEQELREREVRGAEAWEPSAAPAGTLIEMLCGGDPDALERLRRPKGVPGPGGWEQDPDRFARYIETGDWRNPDGVNR